MKAWEHEVMGACLLKESWSKHQETARGSVSAAFGMAICLVPSFLWALSGRHEAAFSFQVQCGCLQIRVWIASFRVAGAGGCLKIGRWLAQRFALGFIRKFFSVWCLAWLPMTQTYCTPQAGVLLRLQTRWSWSDCFFLCFFFQTLEL